MTSPSFAHIGIACGDQEAIERFYTRHFGFRRVRVADLGAEKIVFLRSDGLVLELFQAKGRSPAPPPSGAGPEYPGVRHIAFQVDDVDAKLAAMGEDARVTLGPLGFDDFIEGWKTVWVADPEGNIVEVSQGYHDDEALAHEGEARGRRDEGAPAHGA
jgi:glyoxylase I family protein